MYPNQLVPAHRPPARVSRLGVVRRSTPTLGVVPLVAVTTVASALSKLGHLFGGGIHGEAYNSVEVESIYNAALAGDWGRISNIANGQTTLLPYQNSDGKGGWQTGGGINWADPGYAAERNFANQLLQVFTLGVNLPAPMTPATRSYAGLQAELSRVAGLSVPVATPAAATTGVPASASSSADLIRQAVQAGIVDPAILNQIATGALSIAAAARQAAGASQGARTGAQVGGALAAMSPTLKAVAIGAAVFVAFSVMQGKGE